MGYFASLLRQPALGLCAIAVFASGCTAPVEKPVAATNADYDIGTAEYSDRAVQSLTAWAQLDFETWGSMMADDVEFYFPDGDAGTRTSLIGKTAVLDWWNNWKQTSGVQSMTYRDHVEIPVIAKVKNPYTGLTGPLVISYYSNEIVFPQATVKLRMNAAMYFNSEKQIHRVYTYYDRTKIIEAMGKNVLAK